MKNTLNEIKGKKSIIEVYGLGYVGFPLSVHLSSSGFKVTGIDINPKKLERLKNNSLMESELSLKDEFQRSVTAGLKLQSQSVPQQKRELQTHQTRFVIYSKYLFPAWSRGFEPPKQICPRDTSVDTSMLDIIGH